MNRITPIILVGCIFSVWAAEDKIYPPTTNIFSGIASPSAQAVASPKSAPAVSHANQTSDTKPLTAEELKLKKELEESSAAASAAVASLSQSASAAQKLLESTPTLQLYTQDELNNLIAEHQHLKRVKDEQCQLVPDIEARARIMQLPPYQYLWGDMLITGTCVKQRADAGVAFMRDAADEGMPAAMLRMAQYYQKGQYVQKDMQQTKILMHEAAALGYLEARMDWVSLLVSGQGSPLDYEEAYSWLHHTVIADPVQHAKATRLLNRLAAMMPPHYVARAKAYRFN